MTRQITALALLALALYLLPALAGGGHGGALAPLSVAILGLGLLASPTMGDLAARLGLPRLTGYLVVGLIAGPAAAGLSPGATLDDLGLFHLPATALVGILAGGMLTRRVAIPKAAAIAGAQLLLVTALVILVAGLVVHLLPAASPVAAAGWRVWLPAAVVVAVSVSCLAPQATTAIVEGAPGRNGQLVLAVGVLNNLAVPAILVPFLALAPSGTGWPAAPGQQSASLGAALLLGLLLGALLMVQGRLMARYTLAGLLGLLILASFLSSQTGAPVLVMSLVAGVVLARGGAAGERALAHAERLRLPALVLFFFILGAGLPVDILPGLWPLAILLILLRAVGMHIGTWAGVRLSGAPRELGRTGWLAFGVQGSVLLPLALIGAGSPPSVLALVLAALIMAELLGPPLLKAALGLWGESATRRAGDDLEARPQGPDPSAGRPIPEWLPEPGGRRRDPWGELPADMDRRLTGHLRSVRGELQAVVRDIRAGPLTARRSQALAFLGQLRREFLRVHQRMLHAPEHGEGWRDTILQEQHSMAEAWEGLVLARVASLDFQREEEATLSVIDAVKGLAASLPEEVELPGEARWLPRRPGEPLAVAWARLRANIRYALGGPDAARRLVELQDLARHALADPLPRRLLDPAELIAMGERHLLGRCHNLIQEHEGAIENLLDAELGPDDLGGALATLRDEMEQEFQLARREIDRMADDMVRAIARVLGKGFRDLVALARIAGTPELPRRFSRRPPDAAEDAHREALNQSFQRSARLTRAVAGSMAVELETLRLSLALDVAAGDLARQLSREARGRITVQLQRVIQAVEKATSSTQESLAEAHLHRTPLSEALGGSLGAAVRVVTGAMATADRLRETLRTEEPLDRFMGEAMEHGARLPKTRLVLVGGPAYGARHLPGEAATRELPVRDLATSYLETVTGAGLARVLSELRSEVDEILGELEELHRVLIFNQELARTELELLETDRVDPETASLLGEILLGTLHRQGGRFGELMSAHGGIAARAERGVLDEVRGAKGGLKALLLDGESPPGGRGEALAVGEPDRRIEAALRHLASNAEGLGARAALALGPTTTVRVATFLGLPPRGAHAPPTWPMALPEGRVELPAVYRRIFSISNLDLDDLLSGGAADLEPARLQLNHGPGRGLRVAGVAGLAGVPSTAVLNALVRRAGGKRRLVRWELQAPASVEDVEREVDRVIRGQPDALVLISGIHWLFSIQPGGFAPLLLLLDKILQDGGRSSWLLETSEPAWRYAAMVTPLDDVVGHVLAPGTSSPATIGRMVMKRHSMSGYSLQFGGEVSALTGPTLRRRREEPERQARETAFFQALHRESGGILAQALRLWLASVVEVDREGEAMVMGKPPNSPLHDLLALPEPDLLILRQAMRQGRITHGQHSLQFRAGSTESRAAMARLARRGLLEPQDSHHLPHPALAPFIHLALAERGLL